MLIKNYQVKFDERKRKSFIYGENPGSQNGAEKNRNGW